MASLLGLDLTRNLSYFAVPAAFFCAHAPHLYAVVNARQAYDNSAPGNFKDNILNDKSLDDKAKRHFIRVKRASENGYETLGLFAAGVAIANQAGVPVQTLNAMSWGYIGLRILYNFAYIGLGDIPQLTWLRSLVWGISMILTVNLFIVAGVNAKDGHFA
jgi:uncharacterized MAPEG superfamily protein